MESMKVTMLLADHAQVADGKLFVSGGGWSVTGPHPTMGYIAVLIHVPWSQANAKHKMDVILYDDDGQVATVPTGSDDGERQEIRMSGEFEVGRPPGILAGSSLDMPVALPFGPLPLEPGRRYVWRVTLDGQEDEDWQVAFWMRPAEMRLAG